MSTTIVDAEAFIASIEQKYAELSRIYRNVPPARLSDPDLTNGWSVKDVVAHIAAWEWRCASLLEASRDTDAPLLAEPAVDALNTEIYQERVNWSWVEVKFDAERAHQSLLAAIREFPPERLGHEVVYRTIVQETLEHYSEHLLDLRRWHHNLISVYQ